MKPSIAIAIASIAGSISLAAQQPASAGSGGHASTNVVQIEKMDGSTPQGAQVSVLTAQILSEAMNCPVVLNASHMADGSMVRTGNGPAHPHPAGIGQWLHITVMTPTVSTASLLVNGYSDKARLTQSADGGGPNATQAVTVSFPNKFNGQATGTVWVPGLTAIDSINLVSLIYSDGSNWSAKEGHACRVTPDPLMLISGR